ncbi:UNVERIFIED_CONTAM: Bifunctional aspartokinase/homoserine dehydrogenase 1, chloroplastic [Sesamum latifolium]|uniref:Bifunctional aspartokinase/homoserine dehydrogenase 1, chloroplastic n=1 Tax=Sesamum latifolium TaxID=2727402 RepID=A0AAW2VUR2_9LAMI
MDSLNFKPFASVASADVLLDEAVEKAHLPKGDAWSIHKFGGTCVGNSERIRNVANIIVKDESERKLVVVSAMSKVTDMMYDLIYKAQSRDDSYIIALDAVLEKHKSTAVDLLEGDDLSNFLDRLHQDINNLKAMLRAIYIVSEAVILKKLSYQEAWEMSYFGANVLHPRTIIPVMKYDIPIVIRNIFNLSAPGTMICRPAGLENEDGERVESPVKGFATIDNLALVNVEGTGMAGVPGTASAIFGAVKDVGANVIMISQANINVRAIAQGCSEYNITVVVKREDCIRALRAVHSRFYLSRTTIAMDWDNESEAAILKEKFNIDLRVMGITGSRTMLLSDTGTLSYIFNNFVEARAFSEVVEAAKQAGYTEPDPRDDLSGTDVARKVIILARESGLKLELSDIPVQSLVPEPLKDSSSVEEFLQQLPQYDQDMAKQREEAEASGEVLRYVGVVDVVKQKGTVELRRYKKEHPFAQLSGSDNIIAFSTQRYEKQPLIVRGPGAGAEVTAGGVFSDILRLASYLGAPS